MRWNRIPRGERRTRSGFLILPLRVGNEWRWLEHAVWREEMDYGGDWTAIEWINTPNPPTSEGD